MKPKKNQPAAKQPQATLTGLIWNMVALVFISGLHILLWALLPEVGFWEAFFWVVGGYVSTGINVASLAHQLSHPQEDSRPLLQS